MLARAAAVAPDLLLVDDPTAQLDRSTARVANGVLQNVVSPESIVIVSPESIVIVATHDDETRDACDEHLNLSSLLEFVEVRGSEISRAST